VNRREFLYTSGLGIFAAYAHRRKSNSHITLWASSDPHTLQNYERGYPSLDLPIRHINSLSDQPDISVMLGDFSGSLGEPTTREGELVVSGMINQQNSIYPLAGNHDSGLSDLSWFRTWVDPLGESTSSSGVDLSLRPHQIVGNAEVLLPPWECLGDYAL